MGAGRQPKIFTAPPQDMAIYSASMRNLSKNRLGGVVFGCTKTTIEECLSKQLFGLPGAHFSYVKNITPGLPLFLFNSSDRKLHGIFEAASHGQMNINPYGWTIDGSERTQFPAQVQIRVWVQCQPVLASQFKAILVDNYYSQRNFWFELDHAQTSKVISLLATAAITSSTSVGSLPRIKKWSHMFHALASARTLEFLQPLTSEDSAEFIKKKDLFNAQIDIMEAEQVEEELLYMKLQELALQPNLKSSEGEDTSLSGVVEDHDVINELTLEDIENPREPCPHSSSEPKSGESPRSLTEYQAIIAKLIQEVEWLKAFKIQEVEEVMAFETEFTDQSKKIDHLEHKLEQAEEEIRSLKFCLQLESGSTPSKAHTDEKDTESWNVLHYDPDESIYLVGGYDGESCLSTFDAYYPSEDMMKPLRPISAVCAYASVAQLYGDLYVIGGGNGQVWYDTGFDGDSLVRSVESFDPRLGAWMPAEPMYFPRGYSVAAVVKDTIYVIGGMEDNETIAESRDS